jgi:hypothetical protein
MGGNRVCVSDRAAESGGDSDDNDNCDGASDGEAFDFDCEDD